MCHVIFCYAEHCVAMAMGLSYFLSPVAAVGIQDGMDASKICVPEFVFQGTDIVISSRRNIVFEVKTDIDNVSAA